MSAFASVIVQGDEQDSIPQVFFHPQNARKAAIADENSPSQPERMSWKLLRTWLRGKDLNLRPLGYEFNMWFWMDTVIAKNQSDTVAMCWIISIVPRCLVSNLLALSQHDGHCEASDSGAPGRAVSRPASSLLATALRQASLFG
jgi:hypothetical protein